MSGLRRIVLSVQEAQKLATHPVEAGLVEYGQVTDEMVERGAVAACEFVYPPKTHQAWDEVEDWEQDAWRATVRVAIEAALRAGEPS